MGIRATLHLSQYVYNVDNKVGQITKVLSYYRLIFFLAHASLFLVCVFFLTLCPYVSMGIFAHRSTISNFKMSEHTCFQSQSLWGTYINLLQIPMRVKGSIWIAPNIFWTEHPLVWWEIYQGAGIKWENKKPNHHKFTSLIHCMGDGGGRLLSWLWAGEGGSKPLPCNFFIGKLKWWDVCIGGGINLNWAREEPHHCPILCWRYDRWRAIRVMQPLIWLCPRGGG